MFRATLLLSSLAVVFAADAAHTQTWLYSDVDNRGPANWDAVHAICKEGMEQSPVNIKGVVADSNLRPLEMHYTAAKGFELINNQHSVKVVPTNNDGNYLLDPNNGNKRYNLAQMHFHSPSEHGIGGGLYDLEMHMVHTLADTADTAETFQYLVVGLLFRAGSTPNEHFGFFDHLPTVPMPAFDNYANATAEYHEHTQSEPTKNFDFAGLLSSRRFFTYDGSFTTPPCTEGVKWYVMQETGMVSTAQVDAFRKAMMVTEELAVADTHMWKPSTFQLYGNNRPLQALKSRTVRTFEDSVTEEKVYSDDDDQNSKLALVAIVLSCVAICLVCFAMCFGARQAAASEPTNKEQPADVEAAPEKNAPVVN